MRRGVVWCVVAWLAAAPLPTPAQEPTAADGVPSPQAEDVGPVPSAQIVKRADDTEVYLDGLSVSLQPDDAIQGIETTLPQLSERLRLLSARTASVLAASPSLSDVDDLAGQFDELSEQLTGWKALITTRATQLEQELQGLERLSAIWRATRDAGAAAAAPVAIRNRITRTAAHVRRVRQAVEDDRATLLLLQDRIIQERAKCRDALANLAVYRGQAVGRLLVPDDQPLWASSRWAWTHSEVLAHVGAQFRQRWEVLRDYLAGQEPRVPIQLLLFAVLLVLWQRARRRTARWAAQGDALGPLAEVFDDPFAAAWLLALVATPWIYPQAPPQMHQFVRILAVPAVLRVVDGLVDRPLRPGLYALGAFYVVDRLRTVLAGWSQIEPLLFLLEVLAAAAVLLWIQRTGRLRRLHGVTTSQTLLLLERTSGLVIGALALSLLAGALGFMRLARVIAGAILGSAYAAMVLFAVLRLCEGLWAYALRSDPLQRLRGVRRNRELLQRRGVRTLAWAAVVIWAVETLRSGGLLRPLWHALQAVLATSLGVGNFHLALRDLLAFGVTIWLSLQLSRFVRFALEEDVYPRLRLARGVPYALSNIAHYLVLLVGLLIALAATGLSLDRFAILIGAFGVGIGFGLQNIVNNFVSGLILLFERPVQVGDTVQMGDLLGEVRRIGIRSSTVRTLEGAEVIVPNANLIAEPVTNWTLSDRMRRIDLSVGVAYGTDPERVLALLLGVAKAHRRIVDFPVPVALFLGFGDSSLDFQLRAWTDRFEEWVVTRSELAVAINKALREDGITIPFPQRDVHFDAAQPVPVRVIGDRAGASPGSRSDEGEGS